MPGSSKSRHNSAIRVAILLTSLALCTTALAGPTVTLKKRAVVDGAVTLGDIADIEAEETSASTEDGSDDSADRPTPSDASPLAQVTIGQSPLPGRSRTVSAGYVRMRIARAGIEGVTIEGAGCVELLGAGTLTASDQPRREAPQPTGTPAEPPPPVVHRSQRVQVTLINHGVIIHAAGRAMADAAHNQPVPVRISSTGQQIQGIATQPGRVVVQLGGH
jgi:hypothetical protein